MAPTGFRALSPLIGALLLALSPVGLSPVGVAAEGGTIKGRITFTGKEPGNRVIRMGMDPMCAAANAGKRTVNEVYLVGDNNTLGNVFVKLEGTFPATPVPAQPVEIDQLACFYKPRVVGARVGQTLRVKNGDNLLHNVHSDSIKGNAFNFAEPVKGMQRDITLKDDEMLRIGCDVHRWPSLNSASIGSGARAVTPRAQNRWLRAGPRNSSFITAAGRP